MDVHVRAHALDYAVQLTGLLYLSFTHIPLQSAFIRLDK